MRPRKSVSVRRWSYKDWEGIFYPPECNTASSIRWISLRDASTRWRSTRPFTGTSSPPGQAVGSHGQSGESNFMFTAKLHRSFTHNPMAVMEPTSAASIRPNDEDEALAREGLEALAGEGSWRVTDSVSGFV